MENGTDSEATLKRSLRGSRLPKARGRESVSVPSRKYTSMLLVHEVHRTQTLKKNWLWEGTSTPKMVDHTLAIMRGCNPERTGKRREGYPFR
jgi:hypothetical protein